MSKSTVPEQLPSGSVLPASIRVVVCNVPDVRERLARVSRALTVLNIAMTADDDEGYAVELPLELDRREREALQHLIMEAQEDAHWIAQLDDDVLRVPAPDDDQRDALDALQQAGGAR